MKQKWHIGILIIVLTVLGIVSQPQTTLPNQEIVVQFSDANVASETTQNTIAIVKKHLQDLGVDNIQVKKKEQGKLVITYYIDANVAEVKEVLAKETALKLDYPLSSNQDEQKKLPIDDKLAYNLDVYEIQNTNSNHIGTDGIVIEQKSEIDRLLIPNLYFSNIKDDVNKHNIYTKLSNTLWKTIAIEIENQMYIIPEVRAGPMV